MSRAEIAIQEGRCLLAFGARALADVETLGELRHRSAVPAVALSGELRSPALAISPEVVAHALREGGLIVLVEPDASDAPGMNALADLLQNVAQKPRLLVVARAFNPFALPTPLRLLKMEQDKKSGKDFLKGLPVAAAAPSPAAKAAVKAEEPKKKAGGAPRIQFVGREAELATMAGFLERGGPIVVSGPHGIGKRWLIEKALASATGLKRLPDFSVGWGSEADSLLSRIALLAAEVGDTTLGDALRHPDARPVPVELVKLAVAALANEKLADRVLVIDRLEHALRRDGTFHREGRLELLLRALLTSAYAVHVVFSSTIRPRFYREGEGRDLSVLELGGLNGRELHEIFDAYRVEDFARENFGPIQERIHGHPLAARLFAVAVRDPETRGDLVENHKFMAMESIAAPDVLRRRIERALKGLTEPQRNALIVLAHFHLPIHTADFDGVHVDRQARLDLLASGLLDQREQNGEKIYTVHPLVRDALDLREDYALLEYLGEEVLKGALKLDDKSQEKLALAQEGNRLLFASRKVRNRWKLPFPDNDPALESIRGLIRSKAARPDLAEQRINEALAMDPANPELLLMRAELLIAMNAGADKIAAVFAEAEKQPTPEVFHQQTNWNEKAKAGRSKAIATLERGAAAFPESGRIRRRLAGILLDQHKLDEAITTLKEAQALEPMMPDSYGLLGEVYLIRGAYDLAEEALSEARRLDPDNGLHLARLGALMVERGGLEDEARKAAANEILQAAVQQDGKNYLAHLYLGRFLRRTDGDLEQATWALRRATKLDERASSPWVELAFIALSAGQWTDAESSIDHAIRLDGSSHEAFFARGTLREAQGYVFAAVPEYQKAVERSQPGTAARDRYVAAIERCTELVASGAALEMQKAAESAGHALPEPKVAGTGERREPGKTSRRRRGKGGAKAGATGAEGAEPGAEPGAEGAEGAEPGVEGAEPGAEAAEPGALDAPVGEATAAPEAAPGGADEPVSVEVVDVALVDSDSSPS